MKPKLWAHLRMIWTIATKDVADAIQNKTILGIMVGVAFLMLSSQALPLLTKGRVKPRAFYVDQGRSAAIKTLKGNPELEFFPQDTTDELKKTVGASHLPILGLIIPADFDDQLETSRPITLKGYQIHWAEPADISGLIAYFESELSSGTEHIIRIESQLEEVYPDPNDLGFTIMIVTGLVLGVMILGLALVPLLLVEEKENHTLDSILISPAKESHLVIGKAIAGGVYSLLAAGIMFAFTWRWIVHWEIALLGVILGAGSAVAVGLLIGTTITKPGNVNLWSGLAIILILFPTFLWTSIAPKLTGGLKILFQVMPSVSMGNLIRMALTQTVVLPEVVWNAAALVGFTLVLVGIVGAKIRGGNR